MNATTAAKPAPEIVLEETFDRELALESVEILLEDTFAKIEHSFPEGLPQAELLDFLRVELGLRDSRGAHHPAPGIAAIIEEME